jgi:hypothetical protein
MLSSSTLVVDLPSQSEEVQRPPLNLECRLITSVEELETVRSIWESLQWNPNADFDFYLTIIGVRNEVLRPHVILVENNSIPVALVVGRLERVGFDIKIGYESLSRWKVNQITIIYGGLMGDCSEVVAKSVVDSLLESLRRRHADLVSFSFVRADSSFHRVIRTVPLFCRDFGSRQNDHFNLQMEGAEEIFSRMSSKHRSELRRLPRLLQKQFPVKIKRYTSLHDVARLCDDAESVMAGTYQRALGSGFIKNTENIKRMELSARKGWLLAYFLYAADTPCAFWIGALYRDSLFLEFTGYDPAFGKYEPGTILLDHMIKEVSSSCPHIKNMDYGFGEALYKKRFSNERWHEYSLMVTAPSIKGYCINVFNTANRFASKLFLAVIQRFGAVQRLKSAWRKHLREGKSASRG